MRAPCGRPLSLQSPETLQTYAALAILSDCYPPPKGRLSTCYAPVRRFTQGRSPFLARLACVKPAANVRSEPGSNSPIKVRFAWNNLGETCSLKVLQGYLLLSFSLSPSIQFSAAYFSRLRISSQQGEEVYSGRCFCQQLFFGPFCFRPAPLGDRGSSLRRWFGKSTNYFLMCFLFFNSDEKYPHKRMFARRLSRYWPTLCQRSIGRFSQN